MEQQEFFGIEIWDIMSKHLGEELGNLMVVL